MPKVLVVASADLSPELGETVLWSGGVDRVLALPGEPALEAARRERPNVVVVDGADPLARCSSVAVLSRSKSLIDEESLRRAGANVVFSGRVDPFLWDRRLETLLNVPPRRDARFPVVVDPWSHLGPDAGCLPGWAVNISVRGVLLETTESLDVGTKLDLRFSLPPDATDVRAVGQVVREAAPFGEHPRSGIEFLILLGQARDRIGWFVSRAGEA